MNIYGLGLDDIEYDGEFPHASPDLGYLRRLEAMRSIPVEVRPRDNTVQAHPDGPWHTSRLRDVGYRTGSGNVFSMSVGGHYMERKKVPLLTEYEMYASCVDCKGSSGGCPGFAPVFSKLKPNIDVVFIVAVHLDMRWAMRYSMPGQFAVNNQMTWADVVTDKYIRRLVKAMNFDREIKTGYSLGCGNCGGCISPKQCTVLRGELCIHPERRSFSMEAAGIDVDELHHLLYGEYLPWYYKGTKLMPWYMSRYSMFMCQCDLDAEFSGHSSALYRAIGIDWSYVDIEEVPPSGLLPVKRIQEVPTGAHQGYRQWVYEQ